MLVDLSAQAKFRVTGEDRLRFLNGQLTNDIARLQPGTTLYACALTAKGKLCADLYVMETALAFYLDTNSTLKSALLERLERYIIADDVAIEDISTEFGLLHLFDQDAEQLNENLRALEQRSVSLKENSAFASRANRFVSQGIDIWFPLPAKSSILGILKEQPATAEQAENLRIRRGIAIWGKELSENVIPNEADLQDRAVSYTKGCYLGQEVVSRIKSVGHVNRCLRGLTPVGDLRIEEGDKLVADPASTKEIGSITSVGKGEESNRAIALGFVKRGFNQPGTVLQLRRNNILIGSVEVHSLPLN